MTDADRRNLLLLAFAGGTEQAIITLVTTDSWACVVGCITMLLVVATQDTGSNLENKTVGPRLEEFDFEARELR